MSTRVSVRQVKVGEAGHHGRAGERVKMGEISMYAYTHEA